MMTVRINGEVREVQEERSLAQLLRDLNIERRHLAVEHNGEFVEEDADWEGVIIKAGDKLEIVRFVGGG